MIIYASDLDRTLIYSKRFLEEHQTKCKYSPIEFKDDRIISYMADEVKEELHDINEGDTVMFVPVTSRSSDEYHRVNLGFTPEYAIVANGGMILHNDKEVLAEYNEYIFSKMDMAEALALLMDVEECSHVDKPRMVDNRYIFVKTSDFESADKAMEVLALRYKNWDFTRQNRKIYIIPKFFSKQVALRWLQNYLGINYIIASGDSELDLPMLSIANKAVIPEHGALITDGYVTSGRTVSGGIESPLETIKLVKSIADVKA